MLCSMQNVLAVETAAGFGVFSHSESLPVNSTSGLNTTVFIFDYFKATILSLGSLRSSITVEPTYQLLHRNIQYLAFLLAFKICILIRPSKKSSRSFETRLKVHRKEK